MTTIDRAEGPLDEPSRPLHLRRIDARAAVIVGGVFSAILGFAFLLAGWFVIAVAAQRGVLDQINTLSDDLSSGSPKHVGALKLCVIWTVIVIGWTVVMTAVIGLAAVIFNAVLRLLGGVELDLSPTAPPRPEVVTKTRERLAAVGSRVHAQTAKRLQQIDWSRFSLPGSAKPLPDGTDLRRSKAARARSRVDDREKDATSA